MHGSALRQAISTWPVWRMPLGPERYDRGPLSSAERTALAVLADGKAAANTRTRRTAEAALVRLSRPLHEVYALRRTEASRRALATRVVFGQMHRRGSTFWQWSTRELGCTLPTRPVAVPGHHTMSRAIEGGPVPRRAVEPA
jgi:hypothetical protein